MNRPRRISYQPTEPQRVWLDEEAARLGVAITDLISRILDKERGATWHAARAQPEVARPAPHTGEKS